MVDDDLASATTALIDAIVDRNGCDASEIAAAIFTLPDDLPGANPAAAARSHGWGSVPLLLVREHGGDTAIPRCLRLLVLWNTSRPQSAIRHAYLGGAAALRPDLEADER